MTDSQDCIAKVNKPCANWYLQRNLGPDKWMVVDLKVKVRGWHGICRCHNVPHTIQILILVMVTSGNTGLTPFPNLFLISYLREMCSSTSDTFADSHLLSIFSNRWDFCSYRKPHNSFSEFLRINDWPGSASWQPPSLITRRRCAVCVQKQQL